MVLCHFFGPGPVSLRQFFAYDGQRLLLTGPQHRNTFFKIGLKAICRREFSPQADLFPLVGS